MKRDMKLIRELMFYIEKNHVNEVLQDIKFKDYSFQEIGYHCDLLYQAGLVDKYKGDIVNGKLMFFRVGGLTWKGQDYLELIRNDEIWQKITKEVEDKKLPKTIEFIAKIGGKFTGAVLNELNE